MAYAAGGLHERKETPMKLFTKTLLACGALALASSAMADQAYNDAVDAANSNYAITTAGCKSLSGDERHACFDQAKATREQAFRDAREQNVSVIIYPSAVVYPVHIVTPADRADMQLSNPHSRTMDDPTP
jgi:hypothetical protein